MAMMNVTERFVGRPSPCGLALPPRPSPSTASLPSPREGRPALTRPRAAFCPPRPHQVERVLEKRLLRRLRAVSVASRLRPVRQDADTGLPRHPPPWRSATASADG